MSGSKITLFIKEYFKNLPLLLIASSMAVLMPAFLYVYIDQVFDGNANSENMSLPIFFWSFGHLFAAPGLLLLYLPAILYVKKDGSFWTFVSLSTLCAFLNGLFLAPVLPLFIGVGILTGAFHFILLKFFDIEKKSPSVPVSGFILIAAIILSPVIYIAVPEKEPCASDITTQITDIKLQVPRAYDLGKIGDSNRTRWGWTNFIKPDGEVYWSRIEEGCEVSDVEQSDSVKLATVSYSNPAILDGRIKAWIGRRLAEIKAIGGNVLDESDQLQSFHDDETRNTYLVLPTSDVKTGMDEPVVFKCDSNIKARWCHTSYLDNSGLLISYDIQKHRYETAEELVHVDELVRQQLQEFMKAADNESDDAKLIIGNIIKMDGNRGPRCDGFGNQDLNLKNLTIRIGNDYYRVLNNHIVVHTEDKMKIDDPPCNVDYLEGVSFAIRSKGSISRIDAWTLQTYKDRYEKYNYEFENVEAIDGIKEFEKGVQQYLQKIALLSQNLAPTGLEIPAVAECRKVLNSMWCSIVFHQKGTDVIVSYSKKFREEDFSKSSYLPMFQEAENWANEMRKAAQEYKERTGNY